eukprot:361710-Chlamydomonas_euryale.AAC.4
MPHSTLHATLDPTCHTRPTQPGVGARLRFAQSVGICGPYAACALLHSSMQCCIASFIHAVLHERCQGEARFTGQHTG